MALVNVYDFDKTILPYDSTEAFFKHCLRRHPRVLKAAAPCLPKLPLLLRGAEGKTRAKERFYGFLRAVPDVKAELELFWNEHYKNISAWYLRQSRPEDIIISASPEFLLEIPARRLGVRLIGSLIDCYTGETTGLNNGGEEKVRRLSDAYPDTRIVGFYSDSGKDLPLALLAKRAYMVKDEQVFPWPQDRHGALKRRI